MGEEKEMKDNCCVSNAVRVGRGASVGNKKMERKELGQNTESEVLKHPVDEFSHR